MLIVRRVCAVASSNLTRSLQQVPNTFCQQCRLESRASEPPPASVEDRKPLDYYSSLEPPYLQYRGPALYEKLSIRLQGYDFSVLESFWMHVPRLCESLNLSVVHKWAAPGSDSKVQLMQPNAATVHDEYSLTLYDRYIQVADVPNTKLSLLIRVVRENMPPGVTLTIKEADELDEKVRFMPDKDLLAMQAELEELGASDKKAKKLP